MLIKSWDSEAFIADPNNVSIVRPWSLCLWAAFQMRNFGNIMDGCAFMEVFNAHIGGEATWQEATVHGGEFCNLLKFQEVYELSKVLRLWFCPSLSSSGSHT
jgi:hypothetical protein